MVRLKTRTVLWLWLCATCTPASAASYYLDPAGDDARTGTAPEQAWRTFDKVNSLTLQAGDRLHLRRGGRWEGTLSPRGSGTPENPIRLSAFGEGSRPLIDGGSRPAVLLGDQEGWTIEGLEATNRKDSGQDAIKVK